MEGLAPQAGFALDVAGTHTNTGKLVDFRLLLCVGACLPLPLLVAPKGQEKGNVSEDFLQSSGDYGESGQSGRGLRPVAPRHDAPRPCGPGRGPGARLEGGDVRHQGRPRPGTTETRARRRRHEGRGAEEIVSVDETPKAYGNCARCKVRRSVALSPNSASPRTAVTVIPLARTCRSKVSASCHFGCPRTAAGMRAPARLGSQPRLGQIQQRAEHPRVRPRPQRHGHRGLTIGDLAERAAVLPRHADGVGPCFGKLVPSRMSTPVRSGTVARS